MNLIKATYILLLLLSSSNAGVCKVYKTTATTSTTAPVSTQTSNSLPNPIVPENRYWNGGCATGGTASVNEFGANICEYPGDTCPIVKYFTYSEGGNGVELCCSSNDQCNYDPVKNYCEPELRRCVDGSYFGCSEKAGPIFDSCL